MGPDFSTVAPGKAAAAKSATPTSGSHAPDDRGGWSRAIRNVPKWQKIVFVAFLIVALIAVIAAIVTGGGSESSSSTVRTGHGPDTITDGVPHGYDQTTAGAQTAAVNFMQAVDQASLGRIDTGALRSQLVGSSPTTSLTTVLDSMSGKDEKDRTLSSQPALINVLDYSDSAAKVSVWSVTVSQEDVSGSGNVGILTVWSTTTISLVWEDGDWKAVDWAFRNGPQPSETQFPASDSTMAQLGANGMFNFFVE